jgi:hypothetical protein
LAKEQENAKNAEDMTVSFANMVFITADSASEKKPQKLDSRNIPKFKYKR